MMQGNTGYHTPYTAMNPVTTERIFNAHYDAKVADHTAIATTQEMIPILRGICSSLKAIFDATEGWAVPVELTAAIAELDRIGGITLDWSPQAMHDPEHLAEWNDRASTYQQGVLGNPDAQPHHYLTDYQHQMQQPMDPNAPQPPPQQPPPNPQMPQQPMQPQQPYGQQPYGQQPYGQQPQQQGFLSRLNPFSRAPPPPPPGGMQQQAQIGYLANGNPYWMTPPYHINPAVNPQKIMGPNNVPQYGWDYASGQPIDANGNIMQTGLQQVEGALLNKGLSILNL